MLQIRTTALLTGYVLLLHASAAQTAWGRSFRVNRIPNGNVNGCANCHVNPAGGGTRTLFGNRVFTLIGGTSADVPFWTPSLAAEDSDGDTYCNGQELGDPDGNGTPTAGAAVSNPGVSTSRQVNSPAVFVSTPVQQATVGVGYQYQANAADPDTCQRLTFTKTAGPDWLTVSTNGLIAGTAPDQASSGVEVTLQVRDNGNPAQTATQTYTLSILSTYAGWQAIHFSLPAESLLAGVSNDPDNDGIPNIVEYAYRSNPRAANVLTPLVPTFDANQRMVASVNLRDSDPKLTARMDVAPSLGFAGATAITGLTSDPAPGDGFKTWTFQDPVARTNVNTRFGRIVLELLP